MPKPSQSRSAAIREYFKGHRQAKAQEVADALATKGIKVTTGLVYKVKGELRGRRKRRLAAVAVATKNIRKNGQIDAATLVKNAKELAHQAGGLSKLKELLEALM